jgi:UPF0755 protein
VSDLGLELDPDHTHRSRRRRRNGLGCLAVLVAFGLLAAGGWFAYDAGRAWLADRFDPAEDYAGRGTGSVVIEVHEGDKASDIARTLVEKDVVASVEAFTEAATADPDSTSIQVGFYEMARQMSAGAALEVLLDPDNMVQSAVTLREGLTVDQIVEELAEQTDFGERQYERVLRRPGRLGLPPYAEGNPEGYLFPATYQIQPDATPRSVLGMMVDRFEQAASSLELEAQAAQLGVTPHDVVTIASLIQAEARFDEDFAKVSRVIYNRLEEPMPLQFDSTVKYITGLDGRVGTTDEARNSDSPYNTYKMQGLPPTPINAPGEQALEAALAPADGPWLYFVTTDPDTGVTKFAESYEDHLRNKAEFDAWCRESDTC